MSKLIETLLATPAPGLMEKPRDKHKERRDLFSALMSETARYSDRVRQENAYLTAGPLTPQQQALIDRLSPGGMKFNKNGAPLPLRPETPEAIGAARYIGDDGEVYFCVLCGDLNDVEASGYPLVSMSAHETRDLLKNAVKRVPDVADSLAAPGMTLTLEGRALALMAFMNSQHGV